MRKYDTDYSTFGFITASGDVQLQATGVLNVVKYCHSTLFSLSLFVCVMIFTSFIGQSIDKVSSLAVACGPYDTEGCVQVVPGMFTEHAWK